MSKMLMRDGEIIQMQDEKKPLNGLTIAGFIIACAAATVVVGDIAVTGIRDEYKELKREIADGVCNCRNRRHHNWDADDEVDETSYRRRNNRRNRRRNRNNG